MLLQWFVFFRYTVYWLNDIQSATTFFYLIKGSVLMDLAELVVTQKIRSTKQKLGACLIILFMK